jgi:hypothetical protein
VTGQPAGDALDRATLSNALLLGSEVLGPPHPDAPPVVPPTAAKTSHTLSLVTAIPGTPRFRWNGLAQQGGATGQSGPATLLRKLLSRDALGESVCRARGDVRDEAAVLGSRPLFPLRKANPPQAAGPG